MMSRSIANRLFSSSMCASCRSKLLSLPSLARPFTTTTRRYADNAPSSPSNPFSGLASLSQAFGQSAAKTQNKNDTASAWLSQTLLTNDPISLEELPSMAMNVEPPPHHLHVYATKHNTHITLTKPDYGAIISVSAGNIGFRKAGRGSYDAAYQLAAFVLKTIQDRGLLREILRLEIVLRGFGQGREAVTKAILGSEGRNIRGKVVKVTDATRLKFGGTRSPKPRRLG